MNIEDLTQQQSMFHGQVVNTFQQVSNRIESISANMPTIYTRVANTPQVIGEEPISVSSIGSDNVTAYIHGSLHISGVLRFRIPASTMGAGISVGFRPPSCVQSGGQYPLLYGTITKDIESFAYYQPVDQNNTVFELTQHDAIYSQDQIVTIVLDLHIVGQGIIEQQVPGLRFHTTSELMVTLLEGSRVRYVADL